MEENMNTEQNTQAENMGTEGQGTAQDTAKKFTQEEVNGFVQNRINRMRGQIEKDVKKEYDQKLADLNAREMKLMVKEELAKRDMPRELADIITCADAEDLNNKLDALHKIYGTAAAEKESRPTGFVQIGVAPNKDGEKVDPIRKAMGLGI